MDYLIQSLQNVIQLRKKDWAFSIKDCNKKAEKRKNTPQKIYNIAMRRVKCNWRSNSNQMFFEQVISFCACTLWVMCGLLGCHSHYHAYCKDSIFFHFFTNHGFFTLVTFSSDFHRMRSFLLPFFVCRELKPIFKMIETKEKGRDQNEFLLV